VVIGVVVSGVGKATNQRLMTRNSDEPDYKALKQFDPVHALEHEPGRATFKWQTDVQILPQTD